MESTTNTVATQTRYIETLGTPSTRPYYKVVCPNEWTDEQVKDAFRPVAKQWVGYLCPRGSHGCAGGKGFPLVETLRLGGV